MLIALPFVAAASVLGTSLSSGIACIYIMARSKIKGDGITPRMLQKDPVTDATGDTVRRLLRYSLPVSLAALITTLTGMIDMLTVNPCAAAAVSKSPQTFSHLLEGGLTAQQLPNFIYGSYEALAAAVAGLVPTLTAMLGKSALAGITESFAKGDNKAVCSRLNKMMTGLGISLLAENILSLLFSGRNAEIAAAAPSLRILGAAVVLVSLSLPCFTILQALGKPRTVALIMILGGALKLCGNIVLIRIPRFTLTGAAISTVASELFICIATLLLTYKAANARCAAREVFVKPLYAGLMSTAAAFLAERSVSKIHILTFKPAFVTLFALGFSVIVYLFVTALLCEMPKNVLKSLFCKKNRKNT